MDYKCTEKDTYCDYANKLGICIADRCVIYTQTITVPKTPTVLARTCEICGGSTENLDSHICNDCKRKLKSLMELIK